MTQRISLAVLRHSPLPAIALWGTLLAASLAPTAAYAQNMLPPMALAASGGDPTAALDADTARILARIEVETARSARAETEIAGLGQLRTETNQRLRTRARALYRLTRAGMLPLAGGFDALLGHLARLERLERMVERDAVSVRELRGRGESLRAEIALAADGLARARAELRDVESRKQQLLAAQQASRAFDAALAGNASMPQAAASGYGSIRLVGDSGDSGPSGFAALRGALSVPVSGDLRVGESESGDGSLSIEVAPGTSVRTVAAGRVVFADTQAGYGRLVILDHGDRYYTVYGGLAGPEVGVGDELSRGARVGSASGSALRFEVRRGTRTLDARAWLGI